MAFDVGYHHVVIMLGQLGNERMTHIGNSGNFRFRNGDFLRSFAGVGIKAPGFIFHKVDYIPDGAASKTIDGVMYFVYNDVWYRTFYSGSEVVYIVAENPEKEMLRLCSHRCPHMGQITLEQTLDSLRNNQYEVDVPEEIRVRAKRSVDRMLEIK